MKQTEPPSPCTSLFRIGRNAHGNWVAKTNGASAVDFSSAAPKRSSTQCLKNGNRPQAVVMVPGVLELDFTRKAA